MHLRKSWKRCNDGSQIQRFRKHSARYRFPTDKTPEEIEEVYQNSLKRYTDIIDSSGLPKWKGTLYQGMRFDNGYEIKAILPIKKYMIATASYLMCPSIRQKAKKLLTSGATKGSSLFRQLSMVQKK